MNSTPISCNFIVKEVAKKSGKKGMFWAMKDEKGLAYNASCEDWPNIDPGVPIIGAYTEAKYSFDGKETTSRWLCKSGVEGVEAPKTSTIHSGTENVKIVGSSNDGDKVAAVEILRIALENNLTVSEVVEKYKVVLGQLK